MSNDIFTKISNYDLLIFLKYILISFEFPERNMMELTNLREIRNILTNIDNIDNRKKKIHLNMIFQNNNNDLSVVNICQTRKEIKNIYIKYLEYKDRKIP